MYLQLEVFLHDQTKLVTKKSQDRMINYMLYTPLQGMSNYNFHVALLLKKKKSQQFRQTFEGIMYKINEDPFLQVQCINA